MFWENSLIDSRSVHENYDERWLHSAQHVATYYYGKMGTADERARVAMTPHCLGGIVRETILGIAPMDDFSLTELSWPVTKEINTFLFHARDDPTVRLDPPATLALVFGLGTKDEELRKQVVRCWIGYIPRVSPDIMITMARELANVLSWQPWLEDDEEDFAVPPSRVESSLRGIAAHSSKAGSFALELLLTAFRQKWKAFHPQTGRLVKLATALAKELKADQQGHALFRTLGREMRTGAFTRCFHIGVFRGRAATGWRAALPGYPVSWPGRKTRPPFHAPMQDFSIGLRKS